MVWLQGQSALVLATQGQTCWTCRACLAMVPLFTVPGEALCVCALCVCVHCAGLSTCRGRMALPAALLCLVGQGGPRPAQHFCCSAEAKPLLLSCWQAWWLLCFLPPPYSGLFKNKTFTRSRSCKSRLTRGGFAVSAWKESWRSEAAAAIPCSFLLLLWPPITFGSCTDRRQLPFLCSGDIWPHTLSTANLDSTPTIHSWVLQHLTSTTYSHEPFQAQILSGLVGHDISCILTWSKAFCWSPCCSGAPTFS